MALRAVSAAARRYALPAVGAALNPYFSGAVANPTGIDPRVVRAVAPVFAQAHTAAPVRLPISSLHLVEEALPVQSTPHMILDILSTMSPGGRYTQELHDLFYTWNTETSDDVAGRAFWHYHANLSPVIQTMGQGTFVNPHAEQPNGLIHNPKLLMQCIAAELIDQADDPSDLPPLIIQFLPLQTIRTQLGPQFNAVRDHEPDAPFTQDLHNAFYAWNTHLNDDPVGRAFWDYNRITRDDINPHAERADMKPLTNPSLLLKLLIRESFRLPNN